MYEFVIEGYDKKQCTEYLARIGAEYDGQPSLSSLDMLISRHQKSVPFENLALIMGYGKVETEKEALFRKIVTEKRGGFCFELNSAFLYLLNGLGYDAAGCMARVGLPFLGTLLPLYHMAILVWIDGKQYICDVGLAGPKADWAIEIPGQGKEGIKQTRHGQTFWVEDTYKGWKMLKNEGSESDGSCIIFEPAGMLPSDLAVNCNNLVNTKDSMFHTTRLVNICCENGYADLKNNTLKTASGDRVEEQEIPEKEIPEILKKHFGIILK